MTKASERKRTIVGFIIGAATLAVLQFARRHGVPETTIQRYEEALGGAILVCAGILALWRPQAVRWPANPRRKRLFAVLVIAMGISMATARVLVWQCGTNDPWAP